MSVTVYSTSWCGFCKMAKEYLKGKNIPFDDVNVEDDQNAARAMVEKSGQLGVPVIEIGDHIIIGFDRPRIDQALREAKLV